MQARPSIAWCAFVSSIVVASAPVAGAQLQIETELVASGFVQPLWVGSPPGDERLFVVEKRGRILIVQNGAPLARPFLDLSAQVSTVTERGMHGLAFHPDYPSDPRFFVAYSHIDGPTHVESYVVSPGDPNVADPTSAVLILDPLEQREDRHHGGCLQFGADGLLYVGLGDGYEHRNAQNGGMLKGKLLRLDVDSPFPHVPASNPFVGDPEVRDEIWAIGFRAPWRFSFDRLTGDLYLADVGGAAREEIDFEEAGSAGGRNYGWPCYEGTFCIDLPDAGCSCADPSLMEPIEEYSHSVARKSAVIGGFVYRGCALPELAGRYFYGEFNGRPDVAALLSTRIFSFSYDGVTKSPTVEHTVELGAAIRLLGSFGEDAHGELYLVDYGDGEIFKVVPTNPADCNQNGSPDPCDIASGGSCDVNGNGVPDECESAAPLVYCTAKANSCGALPTVKTTGLPSATAASGFEIAAHRARADRLGMLLYTDGGRGSAPFHGGTLCLAAASILRTPMTSSGGTPETCDGKLALDMNAFASGHAGGTPAKFLSIPGTRVNCQWWGRDTVVQGDLLSDAVEYLVCP